MSNCEGCGILELLSDELLNFLLSDNIDICSGLIQDDNFVTAKNGSHNTDELLLSDTKIVSLFLDLELETLVVIFILFLVVLLLPILLLSILLLIILFLISFFFIPLLFFTLLL